MIRDAQGRKWHMRFRQHRGGGWEWEARCRSENLGWSCLTLFATKTAAEADARRVIPSRDVAAAANALEIFRTDRRAGEATS
jgi:hypothetical protein